MVNVVQPQFNLHSEEANVSKLPLHFFAKLYFEIAFGILTNARLFIQCINFCLFYFFTKFMILYSCHMTPLQNSSGELETNRLGY